MIPAVLPARPTDAPTTARRSEDDRGFDETLRGVTGDTSGTSRPQDERSTTGGPGTEQRTDAPTSDGIGPTDGPHAEEPPTEQPDAEHGADGDALAAAASIPVAAPVEGASAQGTSPAADAEPAVATSAPPATVPDAEQDAAPTAPAGEPAAAPPDDATEPVIGTGKEDAATTPRSELGDADDADGAPDVARPGPGATPGRGTGAGAPATAAAPTAARASATATVAPASETETPAEPVRPGSEASPAPSAPSAGDASHRVDVAGPIIAAAPSTAAAATASVAPAPATGTPPVAQQLVEHVAPLVEGPDGTHELTIELRPATLGRVQLEVTLDDGVLHVRVHAEDPASRRLLAQSLGDLRTALTDAGISAGNLDVGDPHRGDTSAARRDAGRHGGRGAGDRSSAGNGPAAEAVRTRPLPDGHSALDVLL